MGDKLEEMLTETFEEMLPMELADEMEAARMPCIACTSRERYANCNDGGGGSRREAEEVETVYDVGNERERTLATQAAIGASEAACMRVRVGILVEFLKWWSAAERALGPMKSHRPPTCC